MVQLILDINGANITLPETRKGAYKAYRETLGEDVQMISGRLVREVRGSVWRINYQYGYFDDETRKELMKAVERGRTQPITCSFLTQESDNTLTTSDFFVMSFTRPRFMWSTSMTGQAMPLWGDFAIELREVKPSD